MLNLEIILTISLCVPLAGIAVGYVYLYMK